MKFEIDEKYLKPINDYSKFDYSNVLIHYNGKLSSSYTPKSVQLQEDAHMALKQISILENKPMRETINDIITSYIKLMTDEQKELIFPQIRMAQKNMPDQK